MTIQHDEAVEALTKAVRWVRDDGIDSAIPNLLDAADQVISTHHALSATAAPAGEVTIPTTPSDVAGLEVTQEADEAALSYLNEPVQDNCQLAYAFARYGARIRAEVMEDAKRAVRDVMVAQEWPPQDGDRQIDEVLAALDALAAPAEVTSKRKGRAPVAGEKR
ncbi:hypothetical protein PX554_18020 [Sphingomonas sp. H39-1-10]|uniref:hypothetical protein n=1 Tax=Sphingomonas pollutisoli TaxID=3030829 RepID=UPI0023B967CD|nr:hypothetical protein [Sphingomonas pollutisoli]MDF0490036.1 hypothetical protein [Sphingomonas pollutisoli]